MTADLPRLKRDASLYAIARKDLHASKLRLVKSVREAVAAGMSEVQAAKVAGVSRPTIRAWLGK